MGEVTEDSRSSPVERDVQPPGERADERAGSDNRTGERTGGRALLLWWTPLVLLAAALIAVEIWLLDRRPLANDEATSFFIARLDWSSFWESLATSEANGSFFYFLLRFWESVGHSETTLRVLPMAFSVATVPVLFALTRRIFGTVAAFAGAVILASNAMFLENAQTLRSYSLSALMVTLSGWFFVRGLANPSLLNRIGHILASALALYAHFFAALVLLSQVVVSLLFPDRRRSLRFTFVNMVVVSLLASPLVAFVLGGDRGQVDWIAKLSERQVRGALLDLSGMPSTTAMLVLGATIVVGFSLAVWKPPEPSFPRSERADAAFHSRGWRLAFVALWVVLPFVGAVLISLVKPLLIPRYLLVTLPGLAIATGVAVSGFRFRLLAAAATIVLVILAIVQVRAWQDSSGPEEDYANKTRYVLENAEPTDGIAFYAPTIIRPFGYYAGYYGGEVEASAPPEVIYPDKYWLGFSRTRFRPPVERIVDEAGDRGRLWLVTGAARDRPREAERAKLFEALGRACTDRERPLIGVTLFSGCTS